MVNDMQGKRTTALGACAQQGILFSCAWMELRKSVKLCFLPKEEISVACVNLWTSQENNVFVKTDGHMVCDLSYIQECLIYKKTAASSVYVAPNTMWTA